MAIAGLVTVAQIWTNYQCSSGTPATGVMPVEEWDLWERIEGSVVRRTLSLSLPLRWESAADVIARRVVRLYAKDGSTQEYDEFRIRDVEEDVARNRIRIVAEGYEDDLFTSDALVTETVNNIVSYEPISEAQTPSAALTSWVDAFLPSVWGVGTVTPSATMETIQFSYDTPGSAALKIAVGAALASGVTYEISVRRNGTTQLLIDLTVYAAAATTPDIRSRKNLLGFHRRKTSTGQTTRAYTRNGMRHPHFKVSAVSASTYIEVTSLNGATIEAGPAREDDQFNTTFYWFERKNGTSHQITDVLKVSYYTTRLMMASTATISVNDIGYIAGNSSGDVVGAVDSPSLQATWGKVLGLLDGDGDGYTNHMANNPDLRDGGPPPTGYTITGTITYESTAGLFLRGARSAKVKQTGTTNQIETPNEVIQCAAGDILTYQMWLYINELVGSNGLYLSFRNPNSGSYDQYPLDGTIADLVQVMTWLMVSRTYTITSAGAKTFAMRGTAQGALATPFFLVDSFQLVRGPTALDWRRGCGSAASLAAINRHFDTNGAPLATYQAELDDLYVVDPTTYDADKLGLGVTGYFTEGTLAETRTQLRITELRRRGTAPRKPSVVLSTRRSRASTLLTT